MGIYFAGRYSGTLLVPALVLVGIATGAVPAALRALVAQVLLYTRRTGGELLPGLGTAGMNATGKLGMGLSMAVFGALMAAAGFDAGLDAFAVL